MNCPACCKENPGGALFCNQCGTRITPDSEEVGEALFKTSSGFVGRQQELEKLRAALEDARSGQGRLVVLAGEPGIGKTRTAQELAAYAESLGARVLWGRCYEGEGAPPYWPWIKPLQSLMEHTDDAELRRDLGSGAAEISGILPELSDKFPDLELPAYLEPEQARFRLFNSLSTFLKNATGRQLLVLILDDLHWADSSSLLLLEFVAQDLPSCSMLILGTYRDVEVNRRHPLSRTLGALAREQEFSRQQLRGLDRNSVAEILRQAGGDIASDTMVEAILGRTEGNPLFVGEISRAMGQEGKEAVFSIPEGVKDAIGLRLNRLTEECNEILAVASVIGREFKHHQLRILMDPIEEDRLTELLEEALNARIIEEQPQPEGGYHFSHALIQETLAGELTTTRRVRLHAQIAQVLEDLYAATVEDHAAELAHHYAEAESVLGPDRLVRYSLMAGERALATYAWAEAASHFERGLTARGISPEGRDLLPDSEAGALVFGIARARMGTAGRNELQSTVDILTRAFDYYFENGESAKAIAIAEYRVPGSETRIGLSRIISQALTLVVPGSVEEGRLLARYGFELGRTEADDAAGQEAFERALTIARETEDAQLELNTITSFADLDWYQLRLEEAATKSLEAIDLAVQARDIYSEAHARLTAVRAHMLLGRGEATEAQIEAFRALGERLRDRYWQVFAGAHSSHLACFKGNWSQGRDLAETTLQLSPYDNAPLLSLATLEYETGNFGMGEVQLERMLELRAHARPHRGASIDLFPALTIPFAARITGVPFKLDEAAEIARSVLSSNRAVPLYQLGARCALGLLAVVQGDAHAAAEQYQALGEARGTLIPFRLSGDRILGLLAHTMGKLDDAIEHFEESMRFCGNAGYRPELAWNCCDCADTLLQRNLPGDREQAKSLLEESLSISTELGMIPLMERAQSRVDGLGSSRSGHPDGLTQREAEVLTLIAQGKNNREIGEALVITEATARRHVSNIYDKIGVTNRAEATRYALERGVV